MTMQGDDCYFYYYSNCTKGDSCPFRHCEAAMGSEITCSLWQEQMCFRNICKFRHMEIEKNRKEIACYWETQPGGCQKPHCAFNHKKPRMIDGNCIPPNKGSKFLNKDKEEPHEEQVNQVSAPTVNPTNPQLRGVIRTETQESVPSPTHPPVVINPVDDDDEDDQFSEEGDESLGGSPRKLIISKNDSLNFGVQTLEEIRLRKALIANLKRAGQSSLQGPAQNSGTVIEKENSQSYLRLENNSAKFESSGNEVGRRKIADRLGKRNFKRAGTVVEEIPLKRCLAERLGGLVESSTDKPPQKALKPVRERLGLTNDLSTVDSEPKSSGDIHIKTLEEIRQEKAARTVQAGKVEPAVKEVPAKAPSPSKQNGKPAGGPLVKTFSEVLHEKKKLQNKKSEEANTAAGSPERNEGPSTIGAAVKASGIAGEVRVKTLEEIRREKATRMQAQLQETGNDKSSNSSEVESGGAPKRRILRINKTSSSTNTVCQTKQDASDKNPEPVQEANGKVGSSSEPIKVKTFEEIMREKRLRKQQEELGTSTILKEVESPAASPSAPASTTQSSVRQRITLKPKTPPPPTAVVPQQKSPERPVCSSSDSPKAPTPALLPVQVAEGTIQTTETKVKPKVNVKPSVVKPAAQHPQKRNVSKVHHSAVAEVKPLNTARQTPSAQVIPNKRKMLASPPVETDTQSDIQQVSSHAEDVKMVPAEDAKVVPTIEPSSTSKTSETVAVPQSSVIRTPSLRSRRSSSSIGRAAAVSSSSVDDFEDLLDEFTDDRLEDELDLDSGKGEDDLLLELSEMIDN
ncbi:zinc finger CCCH domain-containing protein 11A [Triplophysa rosa]|uniref:Zinc finger CCCH domain-containing protein 11A n=1 Tax=Triplophysa rosa TaxID=992332 RepID=A0A9W7WDI9_TRIRA|nr:zinc finger CCCH domain-containing protein 11A [Triplophysa rosa]XP_057218589.1 zinc finger CCCH domain-containing protein 11A [Triplophysa rosa]XP_057218590.1 zinc finger CCCH domain-containing protein 11A [Triplophysa rosa]KAI7795019.1 zinc finger CCCH domain-containing protein 11A [Triplophysa rosa]